MCLTAVVGQVMKKKKGARGGQAMKYKLRFDDPIIKEHATLGEIMVWPLNSTLYTAKQLR
jgi:hypothetical protein